MAHTKAQKAVSGNRDSRSKRLGIKVYGGQSVKPGYVIVRQRGSKFNAGQGTLLSRDYTIIALKEGIVKFVQKRGEKYVYVS
ncbi:50S ribosomal protein L27 [Candidatus Roizmanbacteria bacterium]|nr:50S ribosomal protein L27 [Candidatus Roizmanbacteria bacterium]